MTLSHLPAQIGKSFANADLLSAKITATDPSPAKTRWVPSFNTGCAEETIKKKNNNEKAKVKNHMLPLDNSTKYIIQNWLNSQPLVV